MMKPIPYGRQHITEEDIEAVVQALTSDFLTQGPRITAFEKEFASFCGSKYAVAVSNGTAALHLAVLALGVKDDEYVICSPLTFAASVNCVHYVGGNVLFADINPKTLLIDAEGIQSVFDAHVDKKIVGIIPVDFAGRVCQLDEIKKIAETNHCWMIEDACHAPGGYFIDHNQQKQLAGNGIFANASVFSFHPVKHIATGEGGMITTNDEALYTKLLALRTHGITRDSAIFHNSIELANGSNADSYPMWYMEMQDLGYNYRITDFQAALGSSQLKRANQGLQRRKEIAEKYTLAFEGHSNIHQCSGLVEGHAYHLFVIEVENRRALYDFLRENQIFAQIHYFPVHLMPYYQKFGWKLGDLPNVENYYKHCISIPMYPSLSDEEVDFVISKIKHFLNQ